MSSSTFYERKLLSEYTGNFRILWLWQWSDNFLNENRFFKKRYKLKLILLIKCQVDFFLDNFAGFQDLDNFVPPIILYFPIYLVANKIVMYLEHLQLVLQNFSFFIFLLLDICQNFIPLFLNKFVDVVKYFINSSWSVISVNVQLLDLFWNN